MEETVTINLEDYDNILRERKELRLRLNVLGDKFRKYEKEIESLRARVREAREIMKDYKWPGAIDPECNCKDCRLSKFLEETK